MSRTIKAIPKHATRINTLKDAKRFDKGQATAADPTPAAADTTEPEENTTEKLHNELKDEGFAVVGFPCNNFGSQEPGSHAQILSFCKDNYGVTFPMMGKIDVKGDKQAPLYKYLTTHPEHGGDVRWNFEKFLVDKSGNVIGHYRSGTRPADNKLRAAIDQALKAQ